VIRPSRILLALAAVHAPLAGASAASVREALEQTYATNPRIEAARARVRQTTERVPQAYGQWKPSLSVNASFGTESEEQDPGNTDNRTPASAQAQLQQPVYSGGSNFARLKTAKHQMRAERRRTAGTTQQTLLRGARAYINVWRDRRLIELAESNVDALAGLLDAAEKRRENGVNTRTDVVQAESRLARGRRRLEDFRGQLRQGRARYEQTVGEAPGEDITYPDLIETLPESEAAAVERARQNAPNVQAARQSASAAEYNIRRQAGQLLPSLSVQGNASINEEPSTFLDERKRASLTLNLQVPLYQQGVVTSRVREAKQTANERQLRALAATRQAAQRARTAWSQLTAARQRVETARVEVDAAKETLDGLREENRVGTRTVQDVLDGQRDVFQAQIALTRARGELAVARFSLVNATGELMPQRLGLNVEPYDPTRVYNAVVDEWWSLDAPESDVAMPAVWPRSTWRGGAGNG